MPADGTHQACALQKEWCDGMPDAPVQEIYQTLFAITAEFNYLFPTERSLRNGESIALSRRLQDLMNLLMMAALPWHGWRLASSVRWLCNVQTERDKTGTILLRAHEKRLEKWPGHGDHCGVPSDLDRPIAVTCEKLELKDLRKIWACKCVGGCQFLPSELRPISRHRPKT